MLRESTRSLFRDPRLTAFAAALLAITIGAITGVFAIVHAVVLQPLPVSDQNRLVIVWQRDDRRALPVIEVAYGEMLDWRARSRSFSDLAVVGSVNWSLDLFDRPRQEPLTISAVSASFFPTVGTMPALGRPLEPRDDDGIGPRSMVISHGLWLRRFGGSPDVLRQPVRAQLKADGPVFPVQIVGVMPAEFDYPRGADAWVPAAPLVRAYDNHSDVALSILRVFFVVGRLKPRVAIDRATTELTDVMRTADRNGRPEPPSTLVVTPMPRYILGPAAPVLWTLLIGSALMLAIACANVAGLHVARSARRERAMAVRLAIGASHARLVGQAFVEIACLTASAWMAGMVVAYVVSRALVALAPAGVPRLETSTVFDPRVLAVSIAAAVLSMIVAGGWPAARAGRLDAAAVLTQGIGAGAPPRARLVQRGLVVAQIAVALTLVAGTVLFFKTVRGLDRTALGFDPRGLLAMSISPGTDETIRWNAFYDALVTRVNSLPGVISADAVALRPLSGPIGWDSQPIFPGQILEQPVTWGLNPHTNLQIVTPGYFETMGIPLRQGRAFSSRDTQTSPGVAIVSESAARRLWPGRNPIGQQLRDPTYVAPDKSRGSAWQTVVGVVEDVRYRGLNDPRLDLYLPHTQSSNRVQQLMIRINVDPAGVVASIRAAASTLDPGVTVSNATLMRDVVATESAPWRFLMRVFVAFAVLAGALAAIGLAAVVSLAVAARMRELAIRAALGATATRLRLMILGETLSLVLLGSIVGLAGAALLGAAVAGVLIGVGPYDASALAAAATLIAGAGLAAAWIPARRAASVNPVEILRAE